MVSKTTEEPSRASHETGAVAPVTSITISSPGDSAPES
jgi:hypothetical protein